MKAKNITGQMPGGQRSKLADLIPLQTPFVVEIFPFYGCIFKCNYCLFSVKPAERGFISSKNMMDIDLFYKCVDDMSLFPEKIKTLRFVGIGEPLLHPQIHNMVNYSKQKNIADKFEIITNGALLTPELWLNLVDAGLDRLVLSVQGTSQQRYKSVCKYKLDFGKFINILKYVYDNKKNVHIYIKIIDCALEGKKDEKKFFEIFGDCCDTIAIENTVPIYNGIDYKGILNKNKKITQFGNEVVDIKVCPQPFFTMKINPDGKVVPCYSFEYPEIIGDCNKQSMKDIWNSDKFLDFRLKMLNGRNKVNDICKKCNIMQYRISPEDVLDGHIKGLLPKFQRNSKIDICTGHTDWVGR